MKVKNKTSIDKNKLLKRLLVIGIILWLGKTYIGQGLTMKDIKAKKIEENKKIAILEREIKDLNSDIDNKDSLEFIEKVAREDHFMVKPREIIYINKNKKENKNNFLIPGTK